MNNNRTSILESDRLIIRKLEIKDAEEAFKNWTSDDDVSRYTTWETHKSINDTRAWLSAIEKSYNNPENYEWGIILKKTGELIGSISALYRENEDNRYELGYCLSKKYWRNGYTTEALKCVLNYLINEKEIKKFICRHAKDNPASGAVMQKAGFKYVRDGHFENQEGTKKFESKEYYLDIK